MVGSRTVTAVVGLLLGLALSVAAWVYFDTLALFVLLPFVPLAFRWRTPGRRGVGSGPPPKECPACGFETRNPEYSHCPRDGRRLMESRNAERDYER